MHQEIHFQLPIGNAVELRLKLKFTDGEDIPVSAIYDTHITIGVGGRNMQEYPYTTDGSSLCIQIPADQELGSYDVHVNSNIDGRPIAAHYKGLIQRVQWGMAVPVPVVETDMIVFGESDEEITDLKERLRASIAAAQAAEAEARAKAEEYAEALSHIDGIAQEATSQDIKKELGKYGDIYDDHTLHGIVGQFGDVAASKTLFGAVDLSRSEASEAKVAAASAELAAQDAKAESVKMANIFQGWYANVWTPFRQLVEQRLSSIITTLGNVAKTLDDIKIDIPSDIARQGEYDGILNQIKDAVTLTAADADADWHNVQPITD